MPTASHHGTLSHGWQVVSNVVEKQDKETNKRIEKERKKENELTCRVGKKLRKGKDLTVDDPDPEEYGELSLLSLWPTLSLWPSECKDDTDAE